MMKFLQSIAPKDADALRTLVGVATLEVPLSACMSEHWTKLRMASGTERRRHDDRQWPIEQREVLFPNDDGYLLPADLRV